MKDLRFSTHIDAPRDKVWDVMLGDATYREWTAAFMPGSYYRGDWSQGSKMLFLGPDPNGGAEGGMVATVKDNRPHEHISLEYVAEVKGGVETPLHPGSFENYTFTDNGGGTDVSVELLNMPDEFAPMFEESWPKALETLKRIAEK